MGELANGNDTFESTSCEENKHRHSTTDASMTEESVCPEAQGEKSQTQTSDANDGSKSADDLSQQGCVQQSAADVSQEDSQHVSLAKALVQKENRQVASAFCTFAVVLAALPVIGLLVCERCLRGIVTDDSTRWTCSGAVAVLLVNLVMVGYVLYCFHEGFPSNTDKQLSDDRDSNKENMPAESTEGKKDQ